MTDDQYNKMINQYLDNIKRIDVEIDYDSTHIGPTTTDALGKTVKIGDVVSLTHKEFGASAIGIVKEITKTDRVRAFYCLFTPRNSDQYNEYGNHRFFDGNKQLFSSNQIIRLNNVDKKEPILQKLLKFYQNTFKAQ